MSSLFLNLIVALQILTALVMIGLVLIQHGKGADMGASFGSGASGDRVAISSATARWSSWQGARDSIGGCSVQAALPMR